MKVILVRQQLRRGDVLNGNRVVRDIRDDGIAVFVIVGRRQESGDVCKDRLADLNCVFCRVEVRNGNLTKIRREDERMLILRHGEGRLAGARDGSIIVGRPAQRARLAGYRRIVHDGSAAAVVSEFEVGLRVCSGEFEIHRRRSIADVEDARGVVIAGMNRTVIYTAQIDLIRARQGAVSGEAEDLSSKRRRRVQF